MLTDSVLTSASAFTTSGSTASASTTSALTAAGSGSSGNVFGDLQTFIQNLVSALHSLNGNTDSASSGTGSDGDKDGRSAVSGLRRAGGGFGAKIHSFLQQLSANNLSSTVSSSDTSSSDSSTVPLSNLSTSFQNLINDLNATQTSTSGSTSLSTATLQSFLQNLVQNTSNDHDISGAFINTQA